MVAEAYPEGGLAYGSDTGSGMTLREVMAMIRMITARPEESGSEYATQTGIQAIMKRACIPI